MKFWFGTPGWGWRLWGVSNGDKWFFGLSIRQGASHDRLLAQQPAAVDEAMVELARKARRLQRDHFGDGTSLHLAMMDWAREYDALAAQHQEPTT